MCPPRTCNARWCHIELRVEADLRLARHHGLIAELRELTTNYPLRERFWAKLMVALYHSRRRPDALDAYRQLRGIFAHELGLDPSAELRDLHQAILADAPDLGLTSAAQPSEITFRPPVPRQLLAPPRLFTGRTREYRDRRRSRRWGACRRRPHGN